MQTNEVERLTSLLHKAINRSKDLMKENAATNKRLNQMSDLMKEWEVKCTLLNEKFNELCDRLEEREEQCKQLQSEKLMLEQSEKLMLERPYDLLRQDFFKLNKRVASLSISLQSRELKIQQQQLENLRLGRPPIEAIIGRFNIFVVGCNCYECEERAECYHRNQIGQGVPEVEEYTDTQDCHCWEKWLEYLTSIGALVHKRPPCTPGHSEDCLVFDDSTRFSEFDEFGHCRELCDFCYIEADMPRGDWHYGPDLKSVNTTVDPRARVFLQVMDDFKSNFIRLVQK